LKIDSFIRKNIQINSKKKDMFQLKFQFGINKADLEKAAIA